jgi:serine/threonine protein kinase
MESLPAFIEHKQLDLSSMLKKTHPNTRSGCNILRRCTQGAQNLFLELQTSGKFSAISTKSYTDDKGKIRSGVVLPVLSKRFQITRLVGEGTFSQIYAAEDHYSGVTIAIKCLNSGLDVLGYLETTVLQHLNKKNTRGSKYFVNFIDSFSFDGHICIAMEYFKATLAQFMNANPVDNISTTEEKKRYLVNIHKPIPRVSYVSSSNSSADTRTSVLAPSSSFFKDIAKLQNISRSLMSALCILRKEGIIHADIKPENIFVNWRDAAGSSYRSAGAAIENCSLRDLPDDFEIRLGTISSFPISFI